MIKRVLKRTFSIFLTLVLLATTFFIFDPSVLKMDANAVVDVTGNKMGSSLPQQLANAPETVYLKPGSAFFQYFSLINPDTGLAENSTSTTGAVTFTNGDLKTGTGEAGATLYVNSVQVKDGSNPDNGFSATTPSAIGLTLNGTAVTTTSNVSPSNLSVASGATQLAHGDSGINYNLVPGNCRIANYVEGNVYMIEWCVKYVTKDTKVHYMFMYTGVYAPRLQITGVTGLGRQTGAVGNTPKVGNFAFVAGAMRYAEKGNRSHIYTGTTAGLNAAPLVLFNGITNNSGTFSIQNGYVDAGGTRHYMDDGYMNEANFPTSGTKTIQVNTSSPNDDPCQYYTSYTSYGSYTNPNPSGTNKGETNAASTTYSGVAYMVVDTSRFTNYNQIPNLSVGYVKYYGINGGKASHLESVSSKGSDLSTNVGNISAQGIDGGNHNELDGQARTWGLYKLSGNIYSGGLMLKFDYKHGINLYVGENTFHLHLGIGLHTTTVNKDSIRKAYCEGLTSNFDNITASTSGITTSFSDYYTKMKTQAMLLCDPTATSNTVSISESTIETEQNTLIANNTTEALFFYVPETIYLTPASSASTFQYYVDRANSQNGALRTGSNTSGNIYLNVPGASSVSISLSGVSSSTIGTTSGTDTINTTITAGTLSTAIAQNTTTTVEWTATYVIDGVTYTAKAYSTVYAPYLGVVATGFIGRYKSSRDARANIENITVWVTGINSIVDHNDAHYHANNGNGTATGQYDRVILTDNAVTGKSLDRDANVGTGMLAYASGGTGYYGGLENDANGHSEAYGMYAFNRYAAAINVDSSRYTNVGQIPNFRVGMDFHELWCDNGCDACDRGYGIDNAGAPSGNSNVGSWTNCWSESGTFGGTKYSGVRKENTDLTGITALNVSATDTTTSTAYARARAYLKPDAGSSYCGYANAYARIEITPVNKANLRAELNRAISTGKSPDLYTSSSWSDYETALKTAAEVLGNPKADQTTVTDAKNDIGAKAAKLKKETGSVNAKHRTLNGQVQSVTGTNTSVFATESEGYNYGDNAYAYPNEYVGYTFDGAFAPEDLVNNTKSNGNSAKKLTWDDTTRTITFKDTSGGSDNYNAYPGQGSSIEGYYYLPVTPGSTMTFKYTTTGPSSQIYAFFAGSDKKTLSSSNYLASKDINTGTALNNSEQTWTFTVPSNAYYITFRLGNRTPNGTTTFTNLRYTTSADINAAYTQLGVRQGSVNWQFYYEPNKTDVKYNPNGGTFNGKTSIETYADIAVYDTRFTVGSVTADGGAAATPTRTGYTFDRWIFDLDSSAYTNGGTEGIINPWKYDTEVVNFTARWNCNKYNIHFEPNGTNVTGTTADMTNVQYDAEITLANGFSRTGYTFKNWNTKADGTGTTYSGTDVVSMLSPTEGATVTLYAQWTPQVYKLDLNGTLDGVSGGNITGYGTADVYVGSTQKADDVSDFYQDVTYGASYTIKDIKATEGHYYAGTASEITGTMPAANTSVNLAFNTEQYTIVFNRNYDGSDGTTVKTLTGVKYNTTQTVTVPTRDGFTFGGWYATRACDTTQVYGTGTSITVKDHGNNGATVTLYAKWTANTITVQYANGGGSGTAPANHTFSYGSSVTPKENTFNPPAAKTVTFNGNGGSATQSSLNSTYSFVNWKSNANSNTYAAGTAVTDSLGAKSGTVTLTAQWTQSAITLPNATRTGYTFNGWYTESSGGSRVGGNASSYTPTAATTTLYAQWSVASYTVNVYAYGNSIGTTGTWTSGTGGTVTVINGTSSSAEESVEYGKSYTIQATPKTGYAFKGWYTTAPTNGTGTKVSDSASYTATMGANAVVYYAKFDIVYCTVTAYAYSNNASALTTWANNTTGGTVKVSGGTTGTTGTAGATSSGKVVTGTSATVTATPATGYHFAGWYNSTTVSGTAVSSANPLSVGFTSEGATVNKYARFDINQNTLKVNPNNGTWNGSTETRTYEQVGGSTLSIPNPTRTGYNFSAWTKNPATLNGTLSGTTYTFPSNVFGQTDTITASWTPITYTIAFNGNGNTGGSMSSLTNCAYGTSYTLPANGFTRTGYDFAGWKVANAGSIIADKASVSNLTTTDKTTVTLYAQWTIKSYNVTVVPYSNTADTPNAWTNSTVGGTVSAEGVSPAVAAGTTVSINYNNTYKITATPKTGYDFVAWYTTAPANGTGTEASTSASYTATMGTAAITYYAKFSIKSFTVTAIAVADSAASTALSTANATNANCTVTPASSTVYYNKNASLTAKAGTGYTFAGWFSDSSCTVSADPSAAITANKTFYAKFTVKKSTVSVVAYSNFTGSYAQNTNGGTVTVEGVSPVISAAPSITMGYNGSYKVTATPATGFTFDGWFTDTALTVAATGATATTATTATFTKKDANETLYAKFSLSASKLTLYAYNNTAADPNNYTNGTTGGTVAINGGTAAKTVEANINYGETATITATPATGYKFEGWYTGVTGGLGNTITAWTTQFTPTDSKSESMTTARTYYAKFTLKSITVTFDPAGGSISSGSATATAYYGTALNAPALTRPGYTLLGWSESQTATEATYPALTISAADVNTMVNAGADKTLYAVWQAFNYTIYLTAASDTANTQGTYKIGTTGGTINYKSGVTKINTGDTIIDCIDVTPATGYELVDVIYRTVTSQPSANSDVTSWLTGTDSFSVSTSGYENLPAFDDNTGIAIIAYFKVSTFTATAYAYSNTAADATYRNTAAGGTVKVGQTGAPGATADESACYGYSNGVTFYATANTGYTFDGWYKDAALTVRDDTATGSSVKVIPGDDRISGNENINNRYAKFSINTHTAFARAKYYTEGVDYATGAGNNGTKGGTVTISSESGATATTTDINAVSISVKFTEAVTYEAKAETGYEFVGWYVCTDTGDTANIDEDEAIETENEYTFIMADADIRIHAKFVPINFVLTLNPNGVGAVNGPTAQVTLTYDSGIILDSSAKPTRSSYKFIGWDETNSATEATYDHKNSNCSIDVAIINRWYNESEATGEKVIYAVWETAKYIVTLDSQGGKGGVSSVEVVLDNPMPPLASVPTYEGYTLAGYFTEPGGDDKYYNADGTSAKNWDIAEDATLYAKWVCPVVKDAIYDEDTGKWTYIYEDTTGADLEADPTDEILTKQGLSENTPDGAKQITSVDEPTTKYVENKIKETEDINLNHYTPEALAALLENVTATNTDLKRGKLSQIELNEYVAKLARYTDIEAPQNKKTTETVKPTVKLYETKDKIKEIKSETLTKDLSVTGDNYSKPNSSDATSFVYTNKYCAYTKKAVDYYIYTNSRTPVVALEIDDGKVGATVASNNASYPTNAEISAVGKDQVVPDKEKSFMHSAVPATDDINNAWFSPYTKANIGTKYDYNAKEIIYLTPSFTPTSPTTVDDEIVYTIKPADDATKQNTGLLKSQIGEIPEAQADSFSSFDDSECPTDAESITVCICYHNAMNGTNEEGGNLGDPYLQMYIDQIDKEKTYADTWLQQMHLFRQSGGANNWELVMADETVYPVEDETFKDTGYVLGSFAYVFDASNEPVAMSYAESGNMEAAKLAIINSIKSNPSEKQAAILNGSHSEHIYHKGVGFFELNGWSVNFYPKQGSYVYAHLIDRWGNIFNKVWKCFNIDEYTSIIEGKAATGFTVTEDGGSNIASISVGCDDIVFLTDVDSTFENDVFTTSGNTFTIVTGKPKSKLPFSVIDNAGNEVKGNIPTDAEGNLKLTIEDLCMDLSGGAYTFMLNDKEINLYAREPALVRSASIAKVGFIGEGVQAVIKTADRAKKVQLDENGSTRTFTKDSSAVTIVDNEDGTITWLIDITSISKGDHTFAVNAKDSTGWYNSDFVIDTRIVKNTVFYDKAIVSVEKAKSYEGEKVSVNVEVKPGTEAIRVTYAPDDYSKTVYRENCNVETTENGTEIWTVPAMTFAQAGEYEFEVCARYMNIWQDEFSVSGTATVIQKKVDGAVIYSVDVENTELKRGEATKMTITTNAATTKIQIVYSTTTTTYTADNAEVTANEDGTLTWVINKAFTTLGDMDVVFRAKSSLGWTEAETFGTITISK